ncbi:MAG: ABC transporter permease subunit [Chloroflexota bacterium]|nr:ABC transporter permease subunit [Chloroflexota bacterium]
MNRHLFAFGLRSSRGGLIAWCVFFILYGILMVYLFEPMQGIADTIAEYAEQFGSMFEIFAGDIGSILNPDGTLSMGKWLSLEYLSLWPLIMAIYAIFFSGNIVARDVDKGTMDMLLSQPIKRVHVIMSKFAVFPVVLIMVAAASLFGIVMGMGIIDTSSDLTGICLVFLPAILLPMAVASYSLLFSCIFLDPRKVLMAAGSLTGLFYLLNILARTVDSLDWLGYLSIFHYYAPGEIAADLSVNWLGIGVYVAIIIICTAASIYVFQRRDISA